MSTETLILEGIKGVIFRDKHPNRSSRSQSGQRQAVNYGGGYWVIEVNTALASRAYHDQIAAFLSDKQGSFDTFKLVIRTRCDSKSAYKGSILVNGANQVTRSINVDGMTFNTKGVLKSGDFIRFGGLNKVYRITQDLDSDGAGAGVLKLNIPIVGDSPADNASIVFNSVDFTVCNRDDEVVTDIDLMQMAAGKFVFEEVWN